MLELRLPPADAYYKIRHAIDEVNNVIASIDNDPSRRLGPERGNVAFASTQTGWCFTLRSFAKLYADTYGERPRIMQLARCVSASNRADLCLYFTMSGSIDVEEFAKRLWGNIYYSEESRNFTRKPPDAESKRSFVHFILEPLYKLYTQVSALVQM